MVYKLSPSSLGVMEECRRCFWLEQNDKWKRPSGPFPTLPRGVDIMLKAYFDIYRDKGEMPPELRIGELEGVRLYGKNEKEKMLLNEWRNNWKGVKYQDSEGNILRGALDNVMVKGEKLIVLDYKTRGFPLKPDTHFYYKNQMDIYNFLLGRNGFNVEDYTYLLFYISDKIDEQGRFLFKTDLIKMKAYPENAEKRFSEAIALLKGPCPRRKSEDKNGCKWCEAVESN